MTKKPFPVGRSSTGNHPLPESEAKPVIRETYPEATNHAEMSVTGNNRSIEGIYLPCIIPAAGSSTRMGGVAKQLLPWVGQKSILDAILSKLKETGFGPIVLVVGGPNAKKLVLSVKGKDIQTILNPAPEPGGMAGSVKIGWKTLSQWRMEKPEDSVMSFPGFLIHPSDYPAVSRKTYAVLKQLIIENPEKIIIPTIDSEGKTRKGHPSWFPARYGREIDGTLPEGMRTILRKHRNTILEVPVRDAGIIIDTNTPEAYEKALKSAFDSEE